MLTIDAILDGLLAREGGFVDHPADRGGRTAYGITERDHPDLWRPGPPTREQARARYMAQYVQPFDLLADLGVDDRVRVACIDDAVLSGVVTAVKTLQRACDVSVDGLLGPITVTAMLTLSPDQLLKKMVEDRVVRFARICQSDPSQLVFLAGWIHRGFLFLP